MSKYCKICKWLNENPFLQYCRNCFYDVNPYYKKKTPLKLIWKKRKERIKESWSEYKVFIEIWKERKHICYNCWKYIKLFHSSCFAHWLNKRDNPKLRYDKNNIFLVHGIFEIKDEKTWLTYNCHNEFDMLFNKLKKWN